MAQQKKTKNEKNQFIYEHFEKELRKAQYINNSNMKFSIQKILRSLTKYPLPILSAQQAIQLEGVGDKSSSTIGKLCRKQYEAYLKPENINSQLNQDTQYSVAISDQQQNISSQHQFSQKQQNNSQKDDFIDFVKTQSQSKKNIKFDINTNPWSILISLHNFNLQTNKNFASKKEIKQQSENLNQIFPCEIKSFNSLCSLENKFLIDKYNFYFRISFGDELKYGLSMEGKQIAKQLYENRILIHEQDTRQPFLNLESLQYQKSIPKKKIKKLEKTQKISTVKEVHSDEENSNKKQIKKRTARSKSLQPRNQILKEVLVIDQVQQNQETQSNIIAINNIDKYQIILIIDNREIFKRDNEEARKIIQNSIKEKYGIQDCQIGQLPIGDFMWVIKIYSINLNQAKNQEEPQIYVLDVIIERKTLDDLAMSILDKRYKDQKQRLQKCGIKHIYYLIEGTKLNGNQSIQQSSVESAITSTQICDQFKIKRTNSLQESIDFLAKLHLIIFKQFKKKFATQEKLEFLSTLDQFLQKNTKHLNNTVQQVYGSMVRSIRYCSQENTQQILDIFQTPLLFYKALQAQGTTEQKKVFLQQICPSIRNKRLLQNLITIFSFDNFPNFLEF